MNLSEHFTLEELTFSEYATRQAIDNTPSQQVIENLILLCTHILEPFRALIQLPLIITSGYRSITVNADIGGSSTSQHCEGKAADFHVSGLTVQQVYDKVKNSKLPFDQLIQEFNQWTHASYNSESNRRMCLIATHVNGKTVYTNDGVIQ
jgi:hypothetical protein